MVSTDACTIQHPYDTKKCSVYKVCYGRERTLYNTWPLTFLAWHKYHNKKWRG